MNREFATTGDANPEYVTARIRARRDKLLDEEDYRKLVRMGPSGIARYLEETEYEAEVDELGTRHRGVDLVEYALNRNLAKHFSDILSWADGRLRDRTARYLRKYDVWNIKTVLRGLYAGTDRETIESDLIRAGELDDRRLEQLLNAETIADAVEGLAGTTYYDPLTDTLPEYEEHDSLIPLENALDRAFYTQLLGSVSGGAATQGSARQYLMFLRAEIDFLNVRNALRLARSGAGMDPTAYFIDGGRLFTADRLRQLVGNTDELTTYIRDSRYGEDLAAALDALEEAESLIQFEHALDAALLEYSDRLASSDPMSIAAVMSYVLAKEREVENIRAIARGREVGLEESEIQEELVIT